MFFGAEYLEDATVRDVSVILAVVKVSLSGLVS